MKGLHNTKSRQRGASTVETFIMSLLLFSLLLGAFQGLLLYRAKISLNHAVTEAVRTGAVNHTSSSAMTNVMAEQLSPLYGGWGTDGAEGLATAVSKAKVDLALPLGRDFDAGAGYELQILSPTQEAFKDFGKKVDDKLEIPNHHLRSRDRTIGATSKVNIQDANLLKIRATYGYKLTVPIASDIIASIMKVADPDRAHYYQAEPPRLPISSTAIARMQSAPRKDEAQLSLKTKLGSGGTGAVPPEDFSEEDAKELEEEITNPGGPTDPTDPVDPPVDPPVDEVECETTWEDKRYDPGDGSWWNPLNWDDKLAAAANTLIDFGKGLVAGLGDQVNDIIELIKDPSILKDLAKAFIKDPKGTIRSMIEGVVQDVEKVMKCGPSDIGRIIGQNLNPAAVVKVLTKLADISGNAKLAKYVDDLDNKIKCTASASFLAGTWVQTPNGLRPIESIALGDFLTARPETAVDAANHSKQVTALHGRTAPNYHRLTTSLGTINATSEHPFWVIDKGWIPAKDLQANDRLATLKGEALLFDNGFQDEPARVYNFTVDESHTYFVAAGPGSGDALWVHNAGRATCWDAGDLELGKPIGHNNGRLIYEVEVDGVVRRVYKGKDGRLYDINDHPMDPIDTDTYKVVDGDRNVDYQDAYENYVDRRIEEGKEFKNPEEYVAAREHWRKGGEAHQADVASTVKTLKNTATEGTRILENRGIKAPTGCKQCRPDIIVIEQTPSGPKVTFYEVKTGDASLTKNQENIYRSIKDGTAIISDSLAIELGITPGTSIKDAFPGGFGAVQEIRGPSYVDR